jgi:hypothetical protein
MSLLGVWDRNTSNIKDGLLNVTGEVIEVEGSPDIRPVHVKVVNPVSDAAKVTQGDLNNSNDSVTTYEALQDGGSSARLSVAAAGTKQAVAATSTPCVGVSFQAYETNTNKVTIGFTDVVAAAATRKGIRSLEADDYHYQPINDASKLYLDSVVNGEGCIVTIHTRSY